MCLNLNSENNILLTASKDMVVYKYVRKTTSGYETPYQFAEVVIGETYNSELNKHENKIYIVNNKTIIAVVERGIHSLKSPWVVFDVTFTFRSRYLAKCIIPKGSLYYCGSFDSNTSYASDTLTYVKVYSKLGGFFKALSVTLKLTK